MYHFYVRLSLTFVQQQSVILSQICQVSSILLSQKSLRRTILLIQQSYKLRICNILTRLNRFRKLQFVHLSRDSPYLLPGRCALYSPDFVFYQIPY